MGGFNKMKDGSYLVAGVLRRSARTGRYITAHSTNREEHSMTTQTETEDSRTLADMQAEVKTVNELNGWFDSTRPFSADIALLHSEVSELHEAQINGDRDNIAEEFADIFIRLLDTAERYEIDLADITPIPRGAEHLYKPTLLNIHQFISRAYEAYRKYGDTDTVTAHMIIANELRLTLRLVMSSAALMNVDLVTEFDKKMAKNRTRGYRHGGKVE